MTRWAVLALLLALPACKAERAQLRQALSGKPPVVAGTLVGRWQVVDLNGGGAPGAVLDFAADGGLAGSGGCNRLMGRWQLGEGLRIDGLGSTRMACAPALMQVEGRLLALLGAANRVIFETGGDAHLVTPDGRRLRLRRAPA